MVSNADMARFTLNSTTPYTWTSDRKKQVTEGAGGQDEGIKL